MKTNVIEELLTLALDENKPERFMAVMNGSEAGEGFEGPALLHAFTRNK